ncbi:MAG TPA: hypothetical protein VGI39_27685 [Polyangiaceae bacterium]|jgi:hypothetical protein
MGDEQKEEEEFVSTLGPIKIDWPRAIGYYGAIGAAVAFDVIAPPLGLFIAAVPLLKLLKRRNASRLERVIAAAVEGAGKPVGGDAEGVVRPAWVDEAKAEEEAKSNGAAAAPRGEEHKGGALLAS